MWVIATGLRLPESCPHTSLGKTDSPERRAVSGRALLPKPRMTWQVPSLLRQVEPSTDAYGVGSCPADASTAMTSCM